MGVRVIESDGFLSSLLRIVDQKAAIDTVFARTFMEDFEKEIILLKRFPSIGSPTQYFDSRNRMYRKVRIDDTLLFYVYSDTTGVVILGHLFNQREDYGSLLS